MTKTPLLTIAFIVLSFSLFGQTNTFPTSGNAGIGTLSPAYPLHVKTSTSANRARFEFGGKTVDIASYGATSEPYGNAGGIFMSGQDGFIMTGSGNNLRFITNSGGYAERMRILSNGNVGINTKNPTYLLSVNGTIGAREVNITTAGWADYVFDDTYPLKPLEEVQKFYQTNGHLENIPTEKEVMANGVNLSEMAVKLLEKVEELTVYLVEQNERIKVLEAQLEKAPRQ
ncbi:hypothetical protein [Algoriphagus sp. Y33]|uniref:hypothetical protein n=1 Tax=Algoriphagus sp. Y33 TaxID=2772483 RepID=UPI00177BCFE9|nr:hypothetical protein [Algoriphagus sp. Y33]